MSFDSQGIERLAASQLLQVTVAVLLAGLLTRVFFRRRPHLAYALWMIVLVKCLMPPVWSCPTGVFSWIGREKASVECAVASSPPPSAPKGNAIAGSPLSGFPAEKPPIVSGAPVSSSHVPVDTPVPVEAAVPVESPEVPFAQPGRTIGPRDVLVLAWLVGAAALAGLLIGRRGYYSVLLRHHRVETADSIRRLVDDLSRRLGLRRPVSVLVTTRPFGPAVYGPWRPTLILPEMLLKKGPVPEVERVIAHELIHVRRRDNVVSEFQLLAQVLWWFHPLVWWANRRICREREFCCDEQVVASLNCDPGKYAQDLLDVLKLRRQLRPALLPGIDANEITTTRLERIMDRQRTFHRHMPRGCWVLLLVGVLLIGPGAGLTSSNVGTAAQSTAASAPADEADKETPASAVPKETAESDRYLPIRPDAATTATVTGLVVNEAEKPLDNIAVTARKGREQASTEIKATRTNRSGGFVFQDLTKGTWYITANDPRFAMEWKYQRWVTIPVVADELPVRIRLVSPKSLGGRVVDEQGKPVAGAKVAMVAEYLEPTGELADEHNYGDMPATTADKDGRFVFDRLRPGRGVFALEHPDRAVTFVEVPLEPGEKALTIQTGSSLRGRVMYKNNPVPNVKLRGGTTCLGGRPTADWAVVSDAKGEFELHHIPDLHLKDGTYVGLQAADDQWVSPWYSVYPSAQKIFPLAEVRLTKKAEAKGEADLRVEIGREKPAMKNRATIRVRLEDAPSKEWFARRPSFSFNALSKETWGMEGIPRSTDVPPDGTCTFHNVPPGLYQIVTGQNPLYYVDDLQVKKGDSLDVVLKKGPGRIYGRINWGENRPAGLYVHWWRRCPNGQGVFQSGARIEPDGRYEITGLPLGKHGLALGGKNIPSTGFSIDLKEPALKFDIDLPQGVLMGKLIGVKPKPKDISHPAALGEIFIRPRGVPPMHGNAGIFIDPDSEGRFQATHLRPGLYTITGYGCKAEANIKNRDSKVEVELKPPENTGQIVGTLSWDSEPRLAEPEQNRRQSVWAFAKDRLGYDFGVWSFHAATDAKDFYCLKDLPEGHYGVFVNGNDGDEETTPFVWIPDVEVRRGVARKLDIRIPKGRRVSIEFDWGTIDHVRSWKLKMPSGDWLDSTVFTGSSIVGHFVLPLGKYELEVAFDNKPTLNKTIELVAETGTHKVFIGP
jgi:beta-lactamase regulating signal transducer with metallopeptidase domain/uncharacterized GH25 family protein